MDFRKSITLSIFSAALFTASMSLAQAPGEQADHSAHHPGPQAGQPTSQEKLGSQMMGGCPMMEKMMGQGMQGMMGSGTMGSEMTPGGAASGMGALFGTRVTPTMNLSVDDVRAYLAAQLNRLKNERLKVGDIKSNDADIDADIVTIDNSLVQRLKVDRHTGAIEYQNH